MAISPIVECTRFHHSHDCHFCTLPEPKLDEWSEYVHLAEIESNKPIRIREDQNRGTNWGIDLWEDKEIAKSWEWSFCSAWFCLFPDEVRKREREREEREEREEQEIKNIVTKGSCN